MTLGTSTVKHYCDTCKKPIPPGVKHRRNTAMATRTCAGCVRLEEDAGAPIVLRPRTNTKSRARIERGVSMQATGQIKE